MVILAAIENFRISSLRIPEIWNGYLNTHGFFFFKIFRIIGWVNHTRALVLFMGVVAGTNTWLIKLCEGKTTIFIGPVSRYCPRRG